MKQAPAGLAIVIAAAAVLALGQMVYGGETAPATPAPSKDAAAAATKEAAPGRPVALQYRMEPGQVFLSERIVRTETLVRAGQESRRIVTEVPVLEGKVVLDWDAARSAYKLAIYETPRGERLTAYEVSGKDRLPDVSESQRLRPLPPAIRIQWQDVRGRPGDLAEKAADPLIALEILHAEMQQLPTEAVRRGQTWTRDVDLGAIKATITTTYTEDRVLTDKAIPCAILDSSAAVTMAPETAGQIQVEKMAVQSAVALGGLGRLSHSGTIVIVQRAGGAETRITRSFEEALKQVDRLTSADLETNKALIGRIEEAMARAKADDLDGALEILAAFIKDNPQGPWTPGAQSMHDATERRRFLTKPSPRPQFRLMLRQMQGDWNRAAAEGNAALLGQMEGVFRNVVRLNAATVIEDATDADSGARDLAAFGLAFLDNDPKAVDRLVEMVKDSSAQVRGSAVLALAIRGKAVAPAALAALVGDADERVRGAAALLAGRTVLPGDPQAAALLPLLLGNLKASNTWTRANTIAAAAALAPAGSPPAAAALVAACGAETEPRLQPAYLQALKKITGVDSSALEPYANWVKQHPAAVAPAPPVPPAPSGSAPEQSPAAPAAPAPKGYSRSR